MTSPNPGGEHRRLVRHALTEWIQAQEIPGIGLVHPGTRPDLEFPGDGGADTDCIVRVRLPDTRESRLAYTGPIDPGGKLATYQAELLIHHRGYNTDEWDSIEDDYDRIIDALKACLRGEGRDLGHPMIIIQAGESGIADSHEDPIESDGIVDRWGTIGFEVSQYLQPAAT